MKHFFTPLVVIFLILQSSTSHAQSTYAQVYQLIQTHCAGSTCHSGGINANPSFSINMSADSFYNEMINRTPVNPTAAANYNKLIAPGDVQHSYLLRKVAYGISDGLKLNYPAEGLDMPDGQSPLANYQIELIRQWILYGAPENGTVVDTGLINTYYRSGGIDDTYSPHDAPAAGTGFQIYYGRVFLGPNTRDTEFFYKVDPHITVAGGLESPEISTMLPANDHHFQILLFQQDQSQNYPWGLRPLAEASMDNDLYGIGSGPGYWDFVLPTNTAFYLAQGQMLDMDLHIQNPSLDSIYSTDLYINVYTEPAGTAQHYMYNNNFPNFSINIPEDSMPHTFSQICKDSTQTTYWNLWKLYTHTHKYGTAFNIWLLNPDGSQGAEIYNGDYSYEDGYDVGYYRWGPHVTFRTWPSDSLFPINPLTGMVGEATWVNTAGPNPVVWGYTAQEEMMVVGFFYTQGEPLTPATGVSTVVQDNTAVRVFPNPFADEFVVEYALAQDGGVLIDLFDVAGNKIGNLYNSTTQPSGKYTFAVHTEPYHLSAGVYLVAITMDGKTITQKMVVTD